MLNMKKGLAVALAAATVLTFAPVSALAGSTIDPKRADTNANKNTLRTTMNETANTWKFEDVKSGEGGPAKTLADENGAVVVLTPSNPTGTVEFSKEITDKDDLSSGKWYTNGDKNDTDFADNGKDQTDSDLKLTTSKYSKTLKIEASVPALRTLTAPVAYTISNNDASADNIQWISKDNITLSDGKTTVDTSNFKVTVILSKDTVKMNNLKVSLGSATDSAYDRYLNHDKDEYDAFEARPTGVKNSAIVTSDNNDVALDGKAITGKTLNLANSSKDITFKTESNADLTYESDDEKIATIDKDGIHAKAVGTTNVKIKTKQTVNSYGEVTVTIPVTVINKPQAELTAPTDLTVHGYGVENSTAIGATGKNILKNSITYDFVWWDAINQKYVSFRSNRTGNDHDVMQRHKVNPFELDKTKDTVFVNAYPGDDNSNYQWNAYLAVSATGAEGYLDPDTKYIKLHFDNSPSFTLDSEYQSLHIGESVQITTKSAKAITGAAFSYKSYNPAVATVSDKGVITAVSEGRTAVDVTYGGTTVPVTVEVKAYENGQGSTAAPEKVTGVTVSNKKGAKVSVSWTSQNGNVNYRVYKKVGSGKWVAKNVTSNKATLSVKKGAKVTVKVKAFVKGTDGKTVWGPKATSKSLKTDRK